MVNNIKRCRYTIYKYSINQDECVVVDLESESKDETDGKEDVGNISMDLSMDLSIDLSIDLLNEFEKNGQILDSIFREFQQTDLSLPSDDEMSATDDEDPEDKITWLETLSNEDILEIENSIYDMIGEYMHDEIESMSSAHFDETMISDITEMLQNQLIELHLSEEK